MNKLTAAAIAVLFSTAAHAAPPVKAAFTGVKSVHTWSLTELNTNLPVDWSPYDFLVVEFRASSSQRFELGLDTSGGRYSKLLGPFAGVWVRASIPLRFYRQPAGNGVDLAATFNQPHNAYWINIHSSGYGPLTNVTGISVAMNYPVGAPTLEIRSVTLATNDPGDAVLEGKPLVDEFGQYTHAGWPGKSHSLVELKQHWAEEEKRLQKTSLTNRDAWGGYLNTHAKATGFFRVEQIGGRWWFVDPDGHWFFSSGVNGVGVFSGTRVAGREDLFAALPPANLVPDSPFGRRSGGSFYTWNLQRRFGDDWHQKWAELTARRLRAWGFNTMHNWGATNLFEPRVPYALMLRGWQTGNSIMGMPDVYAADFARRADETAARQLEPHKNDPFMLGYFIGNEPPWPGRESLLCDAILAGPESEIQRRLKNFLAEGDTPVRRKEFVLSAFQVYVDTINAATRRHAPNHLNLGIRFGGEPSDDVLRAARGFDVFSVNIYRYAPARSTLDGIYALVQRPILIGEFHIGAPERGLAPGLVQAMNQAERGAGYQYYVEQCASHPAVVGTHWFEWLDEPVTGRNDGENYNIGFVDVSDQPYPELVAAAKLTHSRLLEIHEGKIPPTDRMPKASRAGTPLQTAAGRLASRPLFCDPVFDAPTDPVLCFNAEQRKWFMYYTQRRGTATNAPGVTWIHGTAIGTAESSDGGATWRYRGTADISYGKDTLPGDCTYWAPEVIWANGAYQMFLAFVPGIFNDWNHPREIVHLTSADGLRWKTIGPVDLHSDRVIDPCVMQLPGGTWRMWYKDERRPKPLCYADSADLIHWEPKGNAVTNFSGEGPKVFHWKNQYWLIADCWQNGMRVWSSADGTDWKLQKEALFGNHGDVVVSGGRAWWFYFNGPHHPPRERTTAINVAELSVANGKLIADADAPVYIDLKGAREEEK